MLLYNLDNDLPEEFVHKGASQNWFQKDFSYMCNDLWQQEGNEVYMNPIIIPHPVYLVIKPQSGNFWLQCVSFTACDSPQSCALHSD